jgi:GH25 family lysozyme M1 (1,4-beta-N-acetylmuramidase)
MDFVPVIDVSHHQKRIDFSVMRSKGVQGVIIRASRGRTRDSLVVTHAAAARAGGYADEHVGFYTFCNPTFAKPSDAAKVFVDSVQAASGRTDALLMIDVEDYGPDGIGPLPAIKGKEFATWIGEHIDHVRELAPGARLILYTGSYWNDHVRDPGFGHLDCILARYPFKSSPQPPGDPAQWADWIHGATTKRPAVPKGWTDWSGWQFSADGNGLAAHYGSSGSHIDLNIIRSEAWSRWTGGGGIDLAAIDRAMRAVPFPGDLVAPTTSDAAVAVVWCLTAAGFKPEGEAERTYGEPSATACRRFQAAKGLPETGIVDTATWQALVTPPAPGAAGPVGPPPAARTIVVQPGDGWIRIAKRAFGSDARWREIRALNGGEARVLHPGDVLTLPG